MNFRKKCDFMIQTVDFLILDLIQNKLRCKFLDSLMIKCSSLGDGGIIWIAISFLLICYKKYRQAGVLILVGLIMGVLIGNCLLKNIICRPRPCWINRAVSLLIPIPYDYSFPQEDKIAIRLDLSNGESVEIWFDEYNDCYTWSNASYGYEDTYADRKSVV